MREDVLLFMLSDKIFFCNVSRVSKIFETDEIQSKMIFKNHMLVAVGVNGASNIEYNNYKHKDGSFN